MFLAILYCPNNERYVPGVFTEACPQIDFTLDIYHSFSRPTSSVLTLALKGVTWTPSGGLSVQFVVGLYVLWTAVELLYIPNT